MVVEVSANSVTEAYRETLEKMAVYGKPEKTRNGPALVIQEPFVLNLHDPTSRVLIDPTRDANPFFHAMEFVWMMAGSDDAAWIGKFNKQMLQYANIGRLWGAYGARWQRGDQIQTAIDKLLREPTTRQAVISMWDPEKDNITGVSDVCCNTHIYFRKGPDGLDMTVCNRSNDIIWGMLGANVVHMTMLHEVIANDAGMHVGTYRVFTINAHIYEQHFSLMLDRNSIVEPTLLEYYPILRGKENYGLLREDCKSMLGGELQELDCTWMREVAVPIYLAWQDYKNGNYTSCWEVMHEIKDESWRRACQQWISRR